MFSIYADNADRTCAGPSRRELLRVGGLALGGLTLPGLMQARANATRARRVVQDRSVILLFLQGGPSHIEFFDPKMSAPSEIRSITGEVQTTLPGITFGGTFPKLARLAHKLAVVRSYASGNSGHTYNSVASGGNSLKAAMGAIYSRVAGATNPLTGIPNNVLVKAEAVDPRLKLQSNFETNALPTLVSPGELGSAYAAFDPSGGGQLLDNLKLKLPVERFADRRTLLSRLDSFRRDMDRTGAMDDASIVEQRAYEVLIRGIAQAFDLSRESDRVIARYDTSHCFKNEDIQKWFDMRRASNLLGKQLLLARRLCEAGCGFVTVSDCGWDMHANRNSPANMTAMPQMTARVDHAVSALIEDLEVRGLTDKILLVITGEMGRTPRLNRTGGRDHWGNLTTLAFHGGGMRMGQVIGQSDRMAGTPATTKYTPANLLATVLQTLIDPGEVRIAPDAPRNVASMISDGKPIPGLV